VQLEVTLSPEGLNDRKCVSIPYLVQLEGLHFSARRLSLSGFNSILVQLEVICHAATSPVGQRFQFHIGAIRSGCACVGYAGPRRFNSILVQLEAYLKKKGKDVVKRFNSILVQLEAQHLTQLGQAHSGFNSILVQLEDVQGSGLSVVCMVSIPYWCN